MNKLQWILLLILLPQFLFAQDLKGYFFPLKKLCKTKVYQFEVAQKPALTQFWKMKAEEKNGNWQLTTKVYNSDFKLTEWTEEWIDSTGSTLQTFIQFDESGKSDTVELVEYDVFRWQQSEDETIRWSMLMNNAQNATLYFAKERTLLKDCKPPIFKDKAYEVVCFKDALHSVNSDTYEELFAFTQTSYYAKKLGLIGFDRAFEYEEDNNANYRLVKILKEKKWRKLKP